MATTETINQEQELRSQALTVQQRVTAVKIVDQRSYDNAVALLTEIKAFKSRWTGYWEPLREKAYSAYKGILDKLKEGTDPLDQAERQIKHALLAWDNEQRRLQEELQRKAEEEACAKAEAERAQQAFEMEAAGVTDEEIESLMEAPIVEAPPAPVAPTYQKASGISRRDNWCVEVFDVKALCKFIGSGKLKLSAEDSTELAQFMAKLLKPRAVSDKETLNIPGCKAVNKPIIAAR